MHEVGIIKSMLRTVEDVMVRNNVTKVEKIVIQVGELSGVIPKYIEDCYPGAVYKTKFEQTKLEMHVISGTVRCNSCETEFDGKECDLKCPQCGCEQLTPLTGNEFIIKEIVVC